VEPGESLNPLIDLWMDRPIVLAGGFTPETAMYAVEKTHRDKTVAITFGRAFVNHPDLVDWLKSGTSIC
jgi:NADPH2 dehydrogenase